MQKKGIIRATILAVVFCAAIFVFSHLINKGDEDMSADMESATLPRISFVTEGYEVNSLAGYVTDMEITSLRDTVTPVSGYELCMNVKAYEQEIEKISWQVYTMDGRECLQKETIKEVEDLLTLHFNENGMLNNEKVLKITLHLPTEDVYYYTRIMDAENCNYKTCLEFAEYFHTNAVNKTEKDKLKGYLEKSSYGDTAQFQKVTLESGLNNVTWGEMKPKVVDSVEWEIKECNEAYTSLMLSYQVEDGASDEEAGVTYLIEEFFRIRVYGEQKIYLMDYERTMGQKFDGRSNALDPNGICIGIAPDEIEYKSSPDGTIVAFVQNNDLWHYDKEEDEFSMVFSFANAEKTDQRNLWNRHEVHIDTIAENGDMLFHVVGYMNRGKHEGEVGVAVYYFNSEKNSIVERAFVPSKKGYEIMKGELGQFVHYNEEQSLLYVMADGCLYRVNMTENVKEILVRGLTEEQYMVSEEGSLLTYQKTIDGVNRSKQIVFLNLETGEEFTIESPTGAYVKPIGFINEDLVYGLLREEEEGKSLNGEWISPMYQVVIVNQKNQMVKEYQEEGIWIRDVEIQDHVLSLHRVVRSDEHYQDTTSDYITSNQKIDESNISVASYKDSVRGTLKRLEYADGIRDLDAKVLKPKYVLQEKCPSVQLDEAKMKGKFYVYALGHLQGVFDVAGDAIADANEREGVAVSSRQLSIFERGNWPNAYEISAMDAFQMEEGETSMEACLQKILMKEGVEMDVSGELDAGKSPEEILSEYSGGEGLNLTGCTMEELSYLISDDQAVIAMIGEDQAVLLTGYNKTNIAYVDPTSGERKIVTKDAMEQMINGFGSILIGYTK